jgi:hypothetical protein
MLLARLFARASSCGLFLRQQALHFAACCLEVRETKLARSSSWAQLALLYLPRSMARIMFVDAMLSIVFMVPAPAGLWGSKR